MSPRVLWPSIVPAIAGACFAFERVVIVGLLALQPEDERADEVGRHEERAPALVLSDVNKLVGAGTIKVRARLAKDRVAKGDGNRLDRITGEQPGDGTAVKLDDRRPQSDSTTGKEP